MKNKLNNTFKFEKSVFINNSQLQHELQEALFNVWQKHNNWGTFDEGDMAEIYVVVNKVFYDYLQRTKGEIK